MYYFVDCLTNILFFVYFQLKEMEKKLSEYRKGDIPPSPASSGKYDGMYRVTARASVSFSEDTVIHRPPKSRTVAHRLSRSFRERNLLKPNKATDSGKSPRDKNTSVISESSLDESRSTVHESRLDESRFADMSLDTTQSSEDSYKISSDSLYPTSYLPVSGDSHLDMSFLTPPPAHRRREVKCMSPNTRRSKRASWHHTMFQKLSPQMPRANKETAV